MSERGFGGTLGRASGTGTGRSGITVIEAIALGLSVVWVVVMALVLFRPAGDGGAGMAGRIMAALAVMLPIALIWLAAGAARLARSLRTDAAEMRAMIAALESRVAARPAAPEPAEPDEALIEEIRALAELSSRTAADVAGLVALGRPVVTEPQRAAIAVPDPADGAPQPSLSLGTPAEALDTPLTVSEFIKALNFPENDRDQDGFRTLRKALADHSTSRLVRASQDVLTLLSQDGIYMDDLSPDRARPEVWRRFAKGERGRQIAGLGGVRDRSSLALASGRMKQDAVFRDAVHHFLRAFDTTFLAFEPQARDEDIAKLADTRTARAFMLLGRVTGTFD
ncbi:hypothetical protein HKCCE2091_11290 [Rhodobacterales bacterium HKCCE2091]|nr:hypothetical protein [Rhodobacterales bacterium HKCCE2091]